MFGGRNVVPDVMTCNVDLSKPVWRGRDQGMKSSNRSGCVKA
ncbi:Hypothetical protein RY67_924 [Bifidobacterium longum subsp. infantis]|uniref:Uncharacterized protein n=1 Tax=Bifidobacterium longum subsp. infantis TaxID=1682 RepID=A0A0M4LR30_BIFLI|nr:Hypothetical protein RY67_924 [Bifidobacterium longum subsp. infantis]